MTASIFYYYIDSIKNSEESNENNEDENLIDIKKLLSDALLVFQVYYLFYVIQELVIKYKDIGSISLGSKIPLIFERNMGIIVELFFGLIGLALIYFGKSITYAVYQLFIYLAFLIYRKQIADFKSNDNEKKFSFIDYIIVSIMMVLTIVCLFFIKKKINIVGGEKFIFDFLIKIFIIIKFKIIFI